MAATVILISGNPKLRDEIAALLPIHWTLAAFPTLHEARNDPGRFAQSPQEDLSLWIDLTGPQNAAGRLDSLPGHPGRIVAIIDDPARRDSVLRAGADDYLLLPLLSSEIEIRLGRARREGEMFRKLLGQLARRDRQASIGRLTSHICHEINNAMQATRGALALALEEPDLPGELAAYLKLCQSESQRVVDLVGGLREAYFAEDKAGETVALDGLLREVIDVISEEMGSNDTRLTEDAAPDLPSLFGVRLHFYLAFLSLLLNLSEAFRDSGGCAMRLGLRAAAPAGKPGVCAEIAIRPDGEARGILEPGGETLLGLEPAADILRNYGGRIEIRRAECGLVVRVHLPALRPADLGEETVGDCAHSDRG
ncbi:MAG: hypothetical protein JW929_10225 [Anaerolineales bacterium]|nr:hypothetical protein [Anaerolineales bacterium]